MHVFKCETDKINNQNTLWMLKKCEQLLFQIIYTIKRFFLHFSLFFKFNVFFKSLKENGKIGEFRSNPKFCHLAHEAACSQAHHILVIQHHWNLTLQSDLISSKNILKKRQKPQDTWERGHNPTLKSQTKINNRKKKKTRVGTICFPPNWFFLDYLCFF